MTEQELMSALLKEARARLPRYVIIRHEAGLTHGIPDFSVTGDNVTSWIEVKHATPNFKSKGIQELTMNRLALAGHAFYVVYWEDPAFQATYIVLPPDIGRPPEDWEICREGFNHQWVVEEIKKLHETWGGVWKGPRHDNNRPK